ncbi:hypothetical protein B0T24DRAFT_610689 [Lasiosphaeria ovina]|uniref:Secreted protein n=1 Tax=Lasiosphaeria ovina TaxID=92902 RepID=A0AAE0KLX5_9PEZI|nr:hypothetical protein B0T24DRAFT_610689 [Lasiosphaeria ovina]
MFFGTSFFTGALASISLSSIVSLRQWHSSGGRGGGTSFSSLGVIAAGPSLRRHGTKQAHPRRDQRTPTSQRHHHRQAS